MRKRKDYTIAAQKAEAEARGRTSTRHPTYQRSTSKQASDDSQFHHMRKNPYIDFFLDSPEDTQKPKGGIQTPRAYNTHDHGGSGARPAPPGLEYQHLLQGNLPRFLPSTTTTSKSSSQKQAQQANRSTAIRSARFSHATTAKVHPSTTTFASTSTAYQQNNLLDIVEGKPKKDQ
ncbi:unnamed protein product, partial [Amoebophrya sp. A25]|eukprot:GSA25T00010049001.1